MKNRNVARLDTKGAAGVAAERRSQVDERLAEIDVGLDRIRSLLDRLEMALEPVLSEPLDFPVGESEPGGELVPLARKLYSINERIVAIGDLVKALGDRVQV